MTRAFDRDILIWRQLLSQSLATSLTYRAQTAIWMIAGLMPLAMMLIWRQLAGGGSMAGYGTADFTIYFLGVFLVRQLTPMWAVQLLDRGIRQGELSPLLLRPMPPVWLHGATHLGPLPLRAPPAIALFLIGLWLTGVADRIAPSHILLFLPALALAWLILFNMYYCLGLLAFWIDSARAFEGLLWSLYGMLGGSIIPLDLFPPALRPLLHVLPFASTLDFPVETLLGKLGAAGFCQGYALQLFWLAALIALRRSLWQRGLKRFSAAGV